MRYRRHHSRSFRQVAGARLPFQCPSLNQKFKLQLSSVILVFLSSAQNSRDIFPQRHCSADFGSFAAHTGPPLPLTSLACLSGPSAALYIYLPSPPTMAAAAVDKPPRERKMSTHAPVSTLQGPVSNDTLVQTLRLTTCFQVGPGFTRPKHKRTATGFGAGDIKAVESSIPEHMREAWRKYVCTH